MAILKWTEEGINPTIMEYPDGDTQREILELLQSRIELGPFHCLCQNQIITEECASTGW